MGVTFGLRTASGPLPPFAPVAHDKLDDARRVLRERFGYADFRAGQTDAIRTVLARRDVLVVLPTGGGKSLCYQVPALLLRGLTVVISPLISLMQDQVAALERRKIAATFLDSTLSRNEIQERMDGVARGCVKLLYVAPERLTAGDLPDRLRQVGVELLAVDEAHCISEWGHDFRPSYLRLAGVRRSIGSPPTIALTATATPEVRRDIVRQTGLQRPRVIVTGFDRPNLSFAVLRTETERARRAALLEVLGRSRGPAVVYASTRGAVESLASFLSRSRIPAVAYHAGRDDSARVRAQAAFMDDRVRAIVATNAFGMGVDKPDVRTVVHVAMPGTLEAYYQEAGRGGRDGKPAAATLLHGYADRFTHEFFIAQSCPPFALVEAIHRELLAERDGVDVTVLSTRVSAPTKRPLFEAALRVLRGAGLIEENGPDDLVHVRLVATPERVRRTFGGEIEESPALGVLRALWRSHRNRIHDGVTVRLSQLPPGLGGMAGAAPVLDALQARQFVVWAPRPSRLRLTDPTLPLRRAIPPASLERHRAHSLAKLRAMERYAYARTCRRAELLRYFGDTPAATTCHGCDNCQRSGRSTTRMLT
jgi:ATP-dependent DNA helicase RecQ